MICRYGVGCPTGFDEADEYCQRQKGKGNSIFPISNLQDIGKKRDDAYRSYVAAFKQLTSGRGNLVGRAEELKKMGANADKQLSDKVFYECSKLTRSFFSKSNGNSWRHLNFKCCLDIL